MTRRIRSREKRIKNKAEEDEAMEFVDPNEPKFTHPLLLFKYLPSEMFVVSLGLIGAAGLGVIQVMVFYVLGDMINSINSSDVTNTTTNNNDHIRSITKNGAKSMTYVAVGTFVSTSMLFFFMNLAHGLVGMRLKRRYFDRLLDQEIGYFDMKRTGALLNDLSESIETVQDAYTNKVGELTQHLSLCLCGVIMALVANWKMSLAMIAVIPCDFVLLYGVGIIVGVVQKYINFRNGQAANVANEVVNAMRTVRAMDGEESEKRRFWSELKKQRPGILIKSFSMAVTIGFAYFLTQADMALGFWYGGKLITRGEMDAGKMVQVIGYILFALYGVGNSLRVLPEFNRAAQSLKSMLRVIERVPVLSQTGGLQPEKVIGRIEFQNVTFSYPTRPNIQVLKNFSLIIEPGQAVALVGASGSGKSTIVGLIEKFYVPDSGQILLDGIDIAQIDSRWIHRNIGIVTQEPTLFAASITDNILYAVKQSKPHVKFTEEDIISATKAANAHDFIMTLPNGYKTMLGERGVSLSGGQKQRIAIARAMIQDPMILLLDEATSALDTQSESVVQDALNKLMKGRTSIVIAHRLSTVIDSDVIVVMNRGEIKERGTHTELMAIQPKGHYYQLASRQLLSSNNNNEEGSTVLTDQEDENS